MRLKFWEKRNPDLESKIDAATPSGLAAALKLLFKTLPICGTTFRSSWKPEVPAHIGNHYGFDFSGRFIVAIEEVIEFFVNNLGATITIINDTTDHFGKPYRRFELCLMNGERYLMDFYVKSGLWDNDNINKRLYGMCKIYIDPVKHVSFDIVTSNRFNFDDTFLWERIANGSGFPKDIPIGQREYYFNKEDYEFRKEFFEFRGKGGNNVQ